jgi:hypothetical protein
MKALKCLLDGDDAPPPLPPGENERKSKLHTLLSRVGRLMKSNFVDTTNKKTKHAPTSTLPAPPAKQQWMCQVVTPTSASPTPSRSYIRTLSSSLSPESTIGRPNSTNNAILDVMYQGLGVSPPSLHLSSNTDLLLTSNLGLRQLLVSSIIKFDVGATIVVVCSPSWVLSPRDSKVRSTIKWRVTCVTSTMNQLWFVKGSQKLMMVVVASEQPFTWKSWLYKSRMPKIWFKGQMITIVW